VISVPLVLYAVRALEHGGVQLDPGTTKRAEACCTDKKVMEREFIA